MIYYSTSAQPTQPPATIERRLQSRTKQNKVEQVESVESRMRLRSSPGLPRIDGSSVNPCHCQSIKYLKLSKCFIGAMQWSNEQNCKKTAEKCTPGRCLAFKKGFGQISRGCTSALSRSLGSIVQPNRSIWESSSFFYRS